MDQDLVIAITAAIQSYIDTESVEKKRRFGPQLSPWKMGSRRETMTKRTLAVRGNPGTVRLRRFSLI
ncbi:MAG: hypothetical protein JW814_12300 [Candidatus Krumholzibacteriota bacterium]|nr:hypothetical protein [Candidatus Krumholzibacteriota bacterium]